MIQPPCGGSSNERSGMMKIRFRAYVAIEVFASDRRDLRIERRDPLGYGLTMRSMMVVETRS
jgi:hypothetical protein